MIQLDFCHSRHAVDPIQLRACQFWPCNSFTSSARPQKRECVAFYLIRGIYCILDERPTLSSWIFCPIDRLPCKVPAVVPNQFPGAAYIPCVVFNGGAMRPSSSHLLLSLPYRFPSFIFCGLLFFSISLSFMLFNNCFFLYTLIFCFYVYPSFHTESRCKWHHARSSAILESAVYRQISWFYWCWKIWGPGSSRRCPKDVVYIACRQVWYFHKTEANTKDSGLWRCVGAQLLFFKYSPYVHCFDKAGY